MRISLEQALNILMDHVTHGKTERKTLEDCLGLVLSEDVYALLDMPPFSRSAQDGYALCSKDSIGATGENPVKLKVTGKIYAGDHLDVQVRPGEAVRIMTGAMVPVGADCVLRQEDTDEGEETLERRLRKDANACNSPSTGVYTRTLKLTFQGVVSKYGSHLITACAPLCVQCANVD